MMEDQMSKLIQKGLQGRSPQQVKFIVIGILILAIGGSIVWGFLISPKINEELHSRGLERDSNSPLGVSFDSDRNWPLTLPEEVPRVAGGEIWDTEEDFGSWSVRFKDIPDTAVETLKIDLERNYWTITDESRNDTSNVTRINAKYGELLLQFMQNMDVKSATLKVQVGGERIT
ncbi:MAG: hypothetical protein R3B71_04430 [Candidatus Gracilibacteria bacterium]